MRLEATGRVGNGDAYRSNDEGDLGAIWVGETDLVDEIHERGWSDNVRCYVNGEMIAEGRVVSELGWGYSSYTPMDDDEVRVGDTDLIAKLNEFVGQEITVLVTDE